MNSAVHPLQFRPDQLITVLLRSDELRAWLVRVSAEHFVCWCPALGADGIYRCAIPLDAFSGQ